MFVINANASGSASATAYATGSGGNTGVTSVSGYYDIPMNGSTYNMFSSLAYCSRMNNSVYCGWNGNNPNEDSVLSYAKARCFDEDVLFPCNFFCCGGEHQFDRKFNYEGTCIATFCVNNLDVVEEHDLGELPAIIFDTIVSRKQFNGGEKIGRKVCGNIELSISNQLSSCPQCGSCNWCKSMLYGQTLCTVTGKSSYAQKCPITYYVDLGLLHLDGTKTSIKKIESPTAYACLTGLGTCCVFGCTDKTTKIRYTENEGVIACPGDRTYFEFGQCPRCMLYDGIVQTKTSDTCTQNYEITIRPNSASTTKVGACVNALNRSGRTCCVHTRAACSPCDECRFNGIQFSIE